MRKIWVSFISLHLAGALAGAQTEPVAIRGATILTGTGEVIENGTLLIRDGKIEAVGAEVTAPESAEIVEAEGLYLTPGFIDARSSFGLDGPRWDRENLMAPSRRIVEVFEPESDPEWLRAGVTATYVSPGGENLLGGYGAVVKLTGKVVRDRAALSASFGETALDAFEAPTTRQGMIATLRQSFIRVREDTMVDDEGRAIAQVLEKEIPLRVLANTPDDILTALRFGREFDVRVVIDSGIGAHEVADAVAADGVPVVVGPSIVGIGDGGPYEAFAHTPANAASLHEAGVTIALSTFASGGRSVVMEGVMAKAHGLPAEAALRALTLDAAVILGVADRLGSLEEGKDADVVLWENHPLSTWGETKRVIVSGETVFAR